MNAQQIYQLDADTWWDDRDGPMAPLHWMTPARFAYFAEVIGPLAGKRVLDVGCGGGLLAERFAAAGACVVGIDPQEACVAAAREHAGRSGLAVAYHRMSGERLAFDDGSFDVVVAADVLEHVEDLPGTVGEAGRVLRPGGVFVFDTVNRTWLARWVVCWLAERVLRVVPRGAHDPRKFIRPRELARLLTAAGLRLRGVTGLGPTGYRRGRIYFGRLPLTWLSYLGWASRDDRT
jgi:2-polyprenyl-6-hydroxyphenyl methylase/3-demethylubiquinone-9 3-methyltransferase